MSALNRPTPWDDVKFYCPQCVKSDYNKMQLMLIPIGEQ